MFRNFEKYRDDVLVDIMKGRDKQKASLAFNELYRRYSPTVNAYCTKVMHNKQLAEDLFQECFTRFYKYIHANNPKTNLSAYLITIARNLALNHKRDSKPTVSIEEIDFDYFQNPNYEKKELLDLIDMALELLDHEYREAFVLREYNNLSYREIAGIMNISEVNARSRAFRAKQKIKQILAPYLEEYNEKKNKEELLEKKHGHK